VGLNGETGSNRVGAWSLIKGGADYNAGKAGEVSGITVVDEHTIKFDMENPTGLFVNETAQRGQILPKHLLGDVAPADFAKNKFFIDSPVGCGPFKFVQYVPDQYAEFEANPDYWFGRPKINRVLLNIVKSPETMEVAVNNGDIMMGILDGGQYPIATFKKYAADPNFRVIATGGGPVLGYGFNFRKEGIKDPRLHQAFMYAMDRKQLLEKFLGGVGKTVNSFMVHLWYQKPEWADLYPYDPDKAKSLLQEMNWDTNRELTVNVLPIANEDDRAFLAAQQQMLADVGIKIKFAELETSVWVEQFYEEPHEFELAYVTYGVFSDPDGFLYWHIHSSSKNAFGYASPEMDELIEAGRMAINREDRIPIYQQIAERVLQDVPVAAVYRQTFVWFYNPKWVVPEIASLPAIQPDFADMGPGRYLFTDFDAWLVHPEQWDLMA
jgi:peptide/nickel transport system substrate-binding protein